MYQSIEVIPSRVWVHKLTGKQASIYGAVPWTSDRDRPYWHIVNRGWTWECTHRDGSVTVGLCRAPAATKEEAEAIKDRVLSRVGA